MQDAILGGQTTSNVSVTATCCPHDATETTFRCLTPRAMRTTWCGDAGGVLTCTTHARMPRSLGHGRATPQSHWVVPREIEHACTVPYSHAHS